MKEYVKIENKNELEKVLNLYEQLQWTPTIKGLHREASGDIYPVVITHGDNWSFYLSDNCNDGKKYLTVNQVIHLHNSLSYEKKIYIPYTYRDRLLLGMRGRRITVENLEEIHKEGRLVSGKDVSIKYVEESRVLCEIPGGGQTWQHYDCDFKSFKKVSFSTINSYQDVGRPNFVGSERMSNNLGGDYWEVTILIPGSYESHSLNKGVLVKSYVEIVDYSIVDPYSFTHPEIRLMVEERLKPSNYLYYTLL